jgi:hypothetical protein
MLAEVDWFKTGNYIEAAVWGAMAVVLAAYAVAVAGPVRWRCIAAAVLLALFGASDVIEVQTGAWWRPWWLLIWKAVCVVGLLTLLMWHVLQRRRGQVPE